MQRSKHRDLREGKNKVRYVRIREMAYNRVGLE